MSNPKSDYHPAVVCKKCGKPNLTVHARLRHNFQPHSECGDCGHEELEVITFMRCAPLMEAYDKEHKGNVTND